MSLRFWRYRLALLISKMVIIPIGYGSRFHLPDRPPQPQIAQRSTR